jgi:hypothetical protein
MPTADMRPGLPQEHLDAIVACADLVGRSGGKDFEVGYLDETAAIEDARWYATASFLGAKVIIDEQPSGALACELLARKLLEGGQCVHCRRVVTVRGEGVGALSIFGRRGPKTCLWIRDGERWAPANHPIPTNRT